MNEAYQKREFEDKMRAYLAEMLAQLDQIEARMMHREAHIKTDDPSEHINELKRITREAQKRLSQVVETDDASWQHLRSQVQATYEHLLSAINDLENRIVGSDDIKKQRSGG